MPTLSDFQEAFRLLGEYLDYAGAPLRIVIVGGTALNLLGIVNRTTTDADVIAFEENGELIIPAIIPPALRDGITEVASSMRLPADWLNTGPAQQLRFGLPPGFHGRITWHTYGALGLGIAGRLDLISLKLFAAADQWPSRGVHFRDLIAITPTSAELAWASEWVNTQDASPDFPPMVAGVVTGVLGHARG